MNNFIKLKWFTLILTMGAPIVISTELLACNVQKTLEAINSKGKNPCANAPFKKKEEHDQCQKCVAKLITECAKKDLMPKEQIPRLSDRCENLKNKKTKKSKNSAPTKSYAP